MREMPFHNLQVTILPIFDDFTILAFFTKSFCHNQEADRGTLNFKETTFMIMSFN
jgi:hypothetical protein